MKKLALLLAAAALPACASSGIGPSRSANGTSVIYTVPSSYFDVTLWDEQQTGDLRLEIEGPFAEVNTAYALDLRHSGFAADNFQVDIDPTTGFLRQLIVAADGRSREIAANLGRTLGMAAGLSDYGLGGSGTRDESGSRGRPVDTDLIIYQGRWRATPNGGTWSDSSEEMQALNSAIASWYSAMCSQRTPCVPASPPRVRLERSIESTRPQNAPEPDCRRVICYAGPAMAQMRVTVTPPAGAQGQAGASVALLNVERSRTLTALVDDPENKSAFSLRHSGAGGGYSHLIFDEGGLMMVRQANQSEVENTVAMPYDFARGALTTLAEVIPFRVIIDTRRRAAGLADQNRTTDEPQGATDVSTSLGTIDGAAAIPTLPTDDPTDAARTAGVPRITPPAIPYMELRLACRVSNNACVSSGGGGRPRTADAPVAPEPEDDTGETDESGGGAGDFVPTRPGGRGGE